MLKAPDWHGKNTNALIDSMIVGDINEIAPPYEIVIQCLGAAGVEAQSELYAVLGFIAQAGGLLKITPADATLTVQHYR